ncbi:MAG: VacJ family lipoprotein [Ferrovibrio sp.]|uniref:MlaA family lipoprotein n=1 Tax=Ferrovibrio sp. TaxID=1917215 RepID=UPI0026086E6C|nr:VacJ family lipoprotein [Ferrovibrio sp.]MCW0232769.1 VacJ family lipoprotein [Ferrovibrio sp.]
MIAGLRKFETSVPGWAAAGLALALLGACAQVPADPEGRAAYDAANDPAEPTNRVIFAGNQWVDRNALQPVARAYEEYVPDRARRSLRNFSFNLKAPTTLVNDTLQGNFSRAWVTTQRFAVNTTVGGAGLFDVATDWDLPHHEADFGQTFGVWGIGPGPSVQLPLLGPSNIRDSVGRVVGFVANPLSFAGSETLDTVQLVGTGMGMVDQRAAMLAITDELENTSLDYYVTLRSISAQRRAALVEEGKAGEARPRVIVGPLAPPADRPMAPAAGGN